MRVLHITRQGSEVRLEGQTLTIWADGERIGAARIPLLESIVLHGGVNLTTPVLSRLAAEGIDCVFLTRHGRFKARLETLASPAAERRLRQANVASVAASRLRPARAIVAHKLRAQARILRALRLDTPRDTGWLLQSLASASSVAEVQGIEGYATRLYFSALKTALPPALSGWTRKRRPAPDGLNALLGYGYAILQSHVHAAVATVGMDPFIGFLHLPGRPRPAFVLDMMEEFRPLVVEFTCWRLLPRLGPAGWWTLENGSAHLSDHARKALIATLETRLGGFTLHAPTNNRVTVERAMELQIRDFAAALEGHWDRYRPVGRLLP